MQKVILDTNVLVSALIQRNYPYYIVRDLFLDGRFQLCLSDELLAEYVEVLGRKKFNRYPEFVANAHMLLAMIEKHAIKYHPAITLDIIGDQDDNRLLELAEESLADFLITGNTNDFTMKMYKNTKIVIPKEFWETTML